jgi:tetratricopeptide (TPR) repeat protein
MKKFLVISIILLISASWISCDRNTEKRKIRLSEEEVNTTADDQLTTTIHLEEATRRSIAVMFFQNKTGDKNLQWLQKGVSEMLIQALSQSRFLSVLSTDRLFEVMDRLNDQGRMASEVDMEMAAIVAREANVEAILTGNIIKVGDSLQINVKLHEPQQGMILKEESVEGSGLENIFSMVDDLTRKIKEDLQLTLDREKQDVSIAELSTNSLEAWRYYTDGVDFWNKLYFENAIENFKKAIEIDSNFVSAYLRLFKSLILSQRIGESERVLSRLQQLRDKASTREAYEIDFWKHRVESDVNQMIEVSEKWLTEYPHDIEGNFHMGDFYFGAHNFEKAIEFYSRLLTIDPKSKIALNQLGYSHAFLGNYDKAIAYFEKYQQIAPEEANPFDSMGEIYMMKGDFEEAAHNFEKAIQNNPDFAQAWSHLAEIYIDTGEHEKAIDLLENRFAQETDADYTVDIYRNLAFSHIFMGDDDKAARYFDVLGKAPYLYSDAIYYMHDLYIQRKDTLGALTSLNAYYNERLSELDSTTTDRVLLSLAMLSVRLDYKIEETIDLIRSHYTFGDNENTPLRIRFFLTLLYAKSGREEEISTVWESAPSDAFARVLREIRSLSYITMWRFYTILNEGFYEDVESGVTYYTNLIDMSKQNNSLMGEMIFTLFTTDLYMHHQNISKTKDRLRYVGMPMEREWMIIGPYKNDDGFRKEFHPEKSIDLTKGYRHHGRIVRWKHAEDSYQEGYIDLKENFEQSDWSVAYGLIYIKSPEPQRVWFRQGTNESVKVWMNDKEVWRLNRWRDTVFDNDVYPVDLKKGLNKVLIKICNRSGHWGFYFRITDDKGYGVPNIQFMSADMVQRFANE